VGSVNDGSSANTRDQWHGLGKPFPAISSMMKLVSFSLAVTQTRIQTGFWLPRPLIASFVARLPATCVNVETDTHGHDYCLSGGSMHMCDVLRGVLPRLRHLRLLLKVLCAALFVDSRPHVDSVAWAMAAGAAVDIGATGGVVVAPALQTLVLNCAPLHDSLGSATRVCNAFGRQFDDGENPRTHNCSFPLPAARFELAGCLRRLYAGSGGGGGGGASENFLAIERLWMIDMQRTDDYDRSVYAALNRRDVAADKTCVLPLCFRGWDSSLVFMARMPDGREVLSDYWAIEALAEGDMWVTLLGGSRVPAAEAAPNRVCGGRSNCCCLAAWKSFERMSPS
jgi:hypothetical protein